VRTGKLQLDPREWLGDEGGQDVEALVRLTAAMTILSRDEPDVYGPESRAAMREEIRSALENGVLADLESRLRASILTANAETRGAVDTE